MNRYLAQAVLALEVMAYNKQDAIEALEECLGDQSCAGVSVMDLEINIDELPAENEK